MWFKSFLKHVMILHAYRIVSLLWIITPHRDQKAFAIQLLPKIFLFTYIFPPCFKWDLYGNFFFFFQGCDAKSFTKRDGDGKEQRKLRQFFSPGWKGSSQCPSASRIALSCGCLQGAMQHPKEGDPPPLDEAMHAEAKTSISSLNGGAGQPHPAQMALGCCKLPKCKVSLI